MRKIVLMVMVLCGSELLAVQELMSNQISCAECSIAKIGLKQGKRVHFSPQVEEYEKQREKQRTIKQFRRFSVYIKKKLLGAMMQPAHSCITTPNFKRVVSDALPKARSNKTKAKKIQPLPACALGLYKGQLAPDFCTIM